MILLKWLYDVKELNKWPADLIFAFKDIELTTLDVNPTATQNTVVRELAESGMGKVKIARTLGIGVSVAQRV